MIIKIISGALILFSVVTGLMHGIGGLRFTPGGNTPGTELIERMGGTVITVKIFSVIGILASVLILAPQTFVLGNCIRVGMFVMLIIKFLSIGAYKEAAIEIPFLAVPILLMVLKHPLADR